MRGNSRFLGANRNLVRRRCRATSTAATTRRGSSHRMPRLDTADLRAARALLEQLGGAR
jgi:hypothetical protein